MGTFKVTPQLSSLHFPKDFHAQPKKQYQTDDKVEREAETVNPSDGLISFFGTFSFCASLCFQLHFIFFICFIGDTVSFGSETPKNANPSFAASIQIGRVANHENGLDHGDDGLEKRHHHKQHCVEGLKGYWWTWFIIMWSRILAYHWQVTDLVRTMVRPL